MRGNASHYWDGQHVQWTLRSPKWQHHSHDVVALRRLLFPSLSPYWLQRTSCSLPTGRCTCTARHT